MLAVISPLISRGVIDNTRQDLIDLRLWCIDGQEPLHFRLQGNCLRDIAGCRVSFHNKAGFPEVKELPQAIQELRHTTAKITAGDITLSRRAPEKDNRGRLANYLSIEFFVDEAMRVLIETSDFDYELSLPQWECTDEEEAVQRLINCECLRRHIANNVANYRAPVISQLGDLPPCEWDGKLNRAEAYMSIYPTVKEKYIGEPNGYLSAAYVMERTSILGNAADADEQCMPPDMMEQPRDWGVLDFLEPEDAKKVQQAMEGPLFMEVSRMTAVVQHHLINGDERTQTSKEVAAYMAGYAGVVSHILSTILLTMQESYPAGLAWDRMRIIVKRLRALPKLCQGLPDPTREAVMQATARLLQGLNDFQQTIPH